MYEKVPQECVTTVYWKGGHILIHLTPKTEQRPAAGVMLVVSTFSTSSQMTSQLAGEPNRPLMKITRWVWAGLLLLLLLLLLLRVAVLGSGTAFAAGAARLPVEALHCPSPRHRGTCT